MDYNNTRSRNSNVPVVPPTSSLDTQYVYNSYIDHTRLDSTSSTNNALTSPMMMAQASGSRNSAGPRPMSMFDAATATDAVSMSSTLAAAADNNDHQLHAMTAPNTANSDRSFHAILICENAQPPTYTQNPSAGVSTNASFGMPIRPKQGIDSVGGFGNMIEQHRASPSLSSSLPSRNPFMRGGLASGTNASNTAHMRPTDTVSQRESLYQHIAYPALNPNNQPDDWSTPLPSPGISHMQGYGRMENQQFGRQGHSSSSNYPPSGNAANNHLRSAASDHALHSSRSSQQQQQHNHQSGQYQASDTSYQALAMGGFANASPNTGPGQLYPVSQPGLPPAGPASANLPAYAASNRSPLVSRARGRRMPQNMYDYSDANAADPYPLGSSPAAGAGASLPPGMRPTRSAESPADSNSSRLGASDIVRRQPSSEISLSTQSFHGSVNSEFGAQDNTRSTGFGGGVNDSQGMRTTSTYNYPEMGYRSGSAAQDSQMYISQHESNHDQMEMAVDQIGNVCGDGQGAVIGGTRSNISPSGGPGSDARYYGSPAQQGQQGQEYPSAVGSMSHIRWNPTSKGSPLRMELGPAESATGVLGSGGSLSVSQSTMMPHSLSAGSATVAARASAPTSSSETLNLKQQQHISQLYATLPRTGYLAQQGSSEPNFVRTQLPMDMSASSGSHNGSWSQLSPRIGDQSGYSNQQLQNTANAQPESMRRSSVYSFNSLDAQPGQNPGSEVSQENSHGKQAPSILKDYYSISSPSDQPFSDSQVSRADSTSLLPTVEVNKGLLQLPNSNMDEINADSQQYLHRRRRRLTQTMHNRKRSGSAVDVSARNSVSRSNNGPASSSADTQHASGYGVEGHTALNSSAAMGASPSSMVEQDPYAHHSYKSPQVSSSYGMVLPDNYVSTDPRASVYAQAQAQARAQAQAQAEAQMQAQAQAHADYLHRLQHERIQQEQLHMAMEQQRLKLRMAQEQELIRFRNYKPILNLTVDIVETYRKCHPKFYYESARRPRRVLTHPSEGVKNDGFDNENSDYILYVNDIIGDKDGHQFLILEMLGSGTFGQVVKCQNTRTGEMVAVKVIKNKSAYYNQSMMEVQMLDLLNKEYDIDDKHHIMRLKEWFVFRHHLVFVNELLSINLYDLLKQNQYQGLSTNLVRVLVQQILDAMIVLNNAQIIHADLKPENILLESMEKPVVKVIDFGSACFEWQTTFTYIQSRFYRSPEILLGLPYSSRIDMWSLGCIVAELYLGLPLFPGSSEYNQLSRIIELLGSPPANILEKARRTEEFFNYLGPNIWDYKSMTQYSRERNTDEKESKRYFAATTLEELITTYPVRRRMTEAEQQREYQSRIALVDFLRGLLQLDPAKRWSPQQATMHPFITGDPLVGAFIPPHLSGSHQSGSGGGGSIGGGHNSNTPSAFSGHANQGRHYQVQGSSGGASGNMTGHTHAASYGATQKQPQHQHSAADFTNGNTGNENDSVYKYAYPISSGRSSMDENLTIPGSFPANKSIDQSNSTDHGQSTTQTVQQFYRRDSKGRVRATTIGYPSGGAVHLQSTSLNPNEQGLFGHGYALPPSQQQGIGSSFLGVDPSTYFIGNPLTADSEAQGISGHSDFISRSGSDYSGESAHGWAINRYDNSSSHSLGMMGNHGTLAGSLYDYKTTTSGHGTQRSYLLSERQQHRPVQQSQSYQNKFGESCGITSDCSDDGLVPLTRTFVESKNGSSDTAAAAVTQGAYIDRISLGPSVIGPRGSPEEGANGLSLHTTPSTRNEYLFGSGTNSSSALPASVSDRQSSESCLRSDKYAAQLQPPASLLRGSAGFRLVSNFSPLTLPSTPGSSNCNKQCVGSDGAEDVDDIANVVDSYYSNGSASSNKICDRGSDDVASNATADSFVGAQGSETSYSLYSAESGGGGDDGYLTHGNGIGDVDSWVDGDSDIGSVSGESDSHNYFDITQPLVFVESAASQTVGDSGSSVYHNPRFSPQGRDIFNSIGSSFIATHGEIKPAGDKPGRGKSTRGSSPGSDADKDWESDEYDIRDDVDDGSVISQEDRAAHEGELPHGELDESPSFVNLSDWQWKSKDGMNIFEGLKDRDSSSERNSSYSADISSDGGDSDAENTGLAQQDTVVFVGKLRPAQSAAGGLSNMSVFSKLASAKRGSSGSLVGLANDTAQSFEHLHISPSPIPFSIRNVSIAAYPQKIAKKTQVNLRRTSRASQIKDNMRMIESLRRMGKLKDPNAGNFGTSHLADGPSSALC
ncbi:dual specificity protein kinase yak1 [Coemansia sp. RSA 1646]|nr:dual specificity protein kinase yak1 [Coemansia sp. RSA 1646]